MRIFSWIGILLVCFVSGGATCARRTPPIAIAPPPVVWNQTPSLQEITAVINRTANIQQLSSNSASVDMLSMPMVPKLNATLSLERNRNFRLRASVPVMVAAGIDLGSNDEVFWFEVPDNLTKVLYFARHEQYRMQLNRAILPVDPTWVMDALGLVTIDPATVVAGPVQRADGKLEIRSTIAMPSGTYQRVCLIEPQFGFVTDQFLEDPSGKQIARAHASDHRYNDQAQCSLPHQVEMHLVPAVGPPLSMRVEIGSYAVNQLLSSDPQLFVMPQTASNIVDLTTLSAGNIPMAGLGGSSPVEYSASAPTAYPLRGTY